MTAYKVAVPLSKWVEVLLFVSQYYINLVEINIVYKKKVTFNVTVNE